MERRDSIRAVQMDKPTGLLGIRRMNRVPNELIRVLYRVEKRVDESVLHWFGCIEKMENAKRVYVEE